jgi:hypothetical protein
MQTEIDSRNFTAIDKHGKAFSVIAEREVIIAIGGFPRFGLWQFHLEDGRLVLRDERDWSYCIDPETDNIRLTSTDPKQPTD